MSDQPPSHPFAGPEFAPYPGYIETAEQRERWDVSAGIVSALSSRFEPSGRPDSRFVWMGTRALYKSDMPPGELDEMAVEPGSWLPRSLVDQQVELAPLGVHELGQRMAVLVMAAALRDPEATPRSVLEDLLTHEAASDEAFSDETWREEFAPELRRVLAARGVELEP
jgi:hypothetical protein